MNEVLRFLTTAVIWVAYAGTVAAGLLMSSRVSDWVIAVIVVVFGLISAQATRRIWAVAPGAEGATQHAPKAKRDRLDRVARLVDQMDEDEIVELELLVAARDREAGY